MSERTRPTLEHPASRGMTAMATKSMLAFMQWGLIRTFIRSVDNSLHKEGIVAGNFFPSPFVVRTTRLSDIEHFLGNNVGGSATNRMGMVAVKVSKRRAIPLFWHGV